MLRRLRPTTNNRYQLFSTNSHNDSVNPIRSSIFLKYKFRVSILTAGLAGIICYNYNKSDYKLANWFSELFKPKEKTELPVKVTLPDSEKLLPDWPYPDQDIPPGMPALPLLVLDLERTLIGSDFDLGSGWRHIKRPGLAKFIKSLAHQYYEIVIFSENDLMMLPEELFAAIDPDNVCHKFGANKAELRGTQVIKRLDIMNRDLSKIILIFFVCCIFSS